ncbi:MAG: hypothetical protein OIN86_00730 [Candidatus Methanoperedens sp.]|nr:hypothetical protein [Candidatus Methanoperedens sp.]CAG0965532.1 hypothetical protein METP1_00951 [Methanosarcinales archaeon]
MKRSMKIAAVMLAIITLALPIYGQTGGGMMGGKDMMGGGMIGGDMMRGIAKDMMNKGHEMRNQQDMTGMGFMHSEGNNFGNYVTFSVNNNTGAVMNYGITGITIFDSINVANFDLKDSTTVGALTRIANKNSSVVMQLHDNPASVINIKTETATTITFDLADGVKALKEDDVVKIETDNLTAFIVSTNSTSINIDGGVVRIGPGSGSVIFRAMPVNMPVNGMHQKFMGEMMRNRAGAEVSLGMSNKYSIINYSENMNVVIKSMEVNRMRMTINSTDSSGKFVMMNIDNSSLVWNKNQKMRLYLDNKPMRQVMTEQELFDAKESSFWLAMPGGNRMQAMMYIANFSERTVDIVVEDGTTPTPTPAITQPAKTPVSTPATPGFEIMLGLLGAGIAYQLRRK